MRLSGAANDAALRAPGVRLPPPRPDWRELARAAQGPSSSASLQSAPRPALAAPVSRTGSTGAAIGRFERLAPAQLAILAPASGAASVRVPGM